MNEFVVVIFSEEAKANEAGPSARASIERRIDEARRRHDRRGALLGQTLRLVEEARV